MRILIILLFISFSGFSQTYEDIMSIDSKGRFIKVMIENNYYKKDADVPNFIEYSSIDGNYESSYSLSADPQFLFNFFIKKSLLDGTVEIPDTPYDKIFKEVKDRCSFVVIKQFEDPDIEYACYKCSDAQFEGVLGFSILNGIGIISVIID